MIDSLVFYRECLTRAYFLGKESPDASERSLRFHSEVDLWNVSRTMTGGRRKLDSYVSLRSWRFFFSFWGRGGGEIFRRPFGEQVMARGRERSPPTNVVGFKSRRRRHIWECGLSLLLVFSPARRGFSPGIPFSPLLKNQHFQIPIRPGIR